MDSSFAADGEGSESKSPSEMLVSSEGDLEAVWVLWLPAVVMEIAGREKPVEDVVAVGRDLLDEEVVESEDRTTIPATGMRTIQRRRLSKPWVPRRRCKLSLLGLRLMEESAE